MDNQLPTTETSIQRTALVILAVLLIVVLSVFAVYQFRRSDPYVQSVLSLSGDAGRGEVIFQMNCSSCHGIYADGQVGPSLHHVSSRKSRVGLIHQVTSGNTPPMPQFQPNPQEMADLLEYLEQL
ncbi:cytochrome c [Oculatella sp. LEGE 06141]|uniref:c-type cytochrome n=1 Tax=Oculatella sp. LEGE 06141 TaxID=1828648 RepID=UPI00188101F4|nr:cytochrome c [Oculatella sp. LEGE 06141]MBE9182299.1 cytochrome c [Oculatella sp. LEGE 06141]